LIECPADSICVQGRRRTDECPDGWTCVSRDEFLLQFGDRANWFTGPEWIGWNEVAFRNTEEEEDDDPCKLGVWTLSGGVSLTAALGIVRPGFLSGSFEIGVTGNRYSSSQIFIRGSVTGGAAVGAYGSASVFGSYGQEDAPLESGYSQTQTLQAGTAYLLGPEVVMNSDTNTFDSMSIGVGPGMGAYYGVGDRHSYTLASQPSNGC
jgi:hypothetical protein